MKAILNTGRGPACDTLVLRDIPKPVPQRGEVLVRIKTSGLNPSDVKVRAGAQGPMVADEVIIHNDGAGVIEAVGTGVAPGRIGQRVWLYEVNRASGGTGQGVNGTLAEYAAIPEAQAVPLPDAVTFEQGACLGVPAMTAHRAVCWAGDVSGKTVLVTGGAGAVGHSAIQIAKAAGARVITTVSSDEKAKIAQQAGADAVVNYRTEPLGPRLQDLAPAGIDHVAEVDFAAHVALYPDILKPGGTVGAYATASDLTPPFPFYPLAFHNVGVQPFVVYSMPDAAKRQAIADIGRLLATGALAPRVATVFAMSEAAIAHDTLEAGGAVGNIVLAI